MIVKNEWRLNISEFLPPKSEHIMHESRPIQPLGTNGSFVDYGLGFQSPTLRAVFDLWRDKWQNGLLPARGDFDPMEMKPYLGDLFIVESLPEIDNFRYTLIGTRITGWVGVDNTGQLVDAILGEHTRRLYCTLRDEARAGRAFGPVGWRDKDFLRYEVGIFPLSDDKKTVNRFLGCMEFFLGSEDT